MSGSEHSGASPVPGVVVVGGSAGGIEAMSFLLAEMPITFPWPIVVAQHLGSEASYRSSLREVFRRHSRLPVDWMLDDVPLEAGHVHLCPQDRYLSFESRSRVVVGVSQGHRRPHIDILFASAARTWGAQAIGIVLSGYLDDGAAGACAISRSGGVVLVQDRGSSQVFDMPGAALLGGASALVMPAKAMPAALVALTMRPGASDRFRVGSNSPYLATV